MLKSMQLPSSLKSIGEYAFLNCMNLKTVNFPQRVTSISNSAFKYCFALERVKLQSIMKFNLFACFENCQNLKNIDVGEENVVYSSLDGMLFDKEKTTLLYCAGKRGVVKIPETVETIAESAFVSLTAAKVYFPSSVKRFATKSLPVISTEKGMLHLYLPCTDVPELDGRQSVAKLIVSETRTYKGYSATGTKEKKTVLHVPKGCKQKYLDHPVWGKLFGGDKGEIKDDIK